MNEVRKNVVFSICAKNYLSQALSLKESCLRRNPNIDFFIFLSDLPDADVPKEVILLDDSWVSNWMEMAFKYNVIEFSTSIKPYSINYLFNLGYEKVIYLDPDIYVTDSLDVIWNYLESKSLVLSPHYCHIQEKYTGSVSEEELLFVGIYNLGFFAVANNQIGNMVIRWWMNRLFSKCYADKIDALHVDQKWMDFIPAFFPNDLLITHHPGINPAIWNLHERELYLQEDRCFIKDVVTGEKYPLLFFHFSGFDPFNNTVINRRHPKYNTQNFPSFIPLFKEYIEAEYRNKYDLYSKKSYSFNAFLDGTYILPLHRRLFRIYSDTLKGDNPFETTSKVYTLLSYNKMLSRIHADRFNSVKTNMNERKDRVTSFFLFFLKFVKKTFGVDRYYAFITILHKLTRYEKQSFLIKRKK